MLCFLGVFLTSCSGKVQTNPIPESKKYTLPSYKASEQRLIEEVPVVYIQDYDRYAKEFFKADKNKYEKNIFSIGLERGHYE